MFPLDSFRLARTLAVSAGVLAGSSVALAATGGPWRAVAVLAALACLLAYAAHYEARNVRATRRATRVRRNLQALNVVRLADFAAREHAAVYGEALS